MNGNSSAVIDSAPDEEVVIHKSDGVTRRADKVQILSHGSLAVWDSHGDNEDPDILVQGDKWERVEREGHSWRQTTSKAVMEEARKRDDVDEDEVANML
jgi:hypothetical protein